MHLFVYTVYRVCCFDLFSDDFKSWYYGSLNDVMMNEYCSGSDMKDAVLPILRKVKCVCVFVELCVISSFGLTA